MRHGTEELLVLHGPEPKASDLNLIKLAHFFGLRVRQVAWETGKSSNSIWPGARIHDCPYALAVRAKFLRQFTDESFWKVWRSGGAGLAAHVFVYGFAPDARDATLVQRVSGGTLKSIRELALSDRQYRFDIGSKSFCQEFSGLSFGPVDAENDLVFQPQSDSPSRIDLISIGQRPFLTAIRNGPAVTFLSGGREIVDIDALFPRGAKMLDFFSKFAPVMLFLRHAFGERCWQPGKKLACFILDDPLLRNRYGFLEYAALLESMQRGNFATSVAFIPWNYRRSQRKVTQLFHANPERLSLSIHGCDHTKGEFGEADELLLSQKAVTAQKRLARHRDLTRVPFDRVMVFPQGVFSAAALRALKTSNYLAAVNSTPFSVDDPPHRLRVRDLLSPAVMAYAGFPLFVRHYPNCIADFALDLFLGKPALIVEHHDYFRSGYKKIQEFAGQINRLSEGITWCGLEEIVRNVCLVRRRGDGAVERRFYCNEALVESGGENINGGSISTTGNGELSSTLDNAELRFGSRRYRIAVSIRRRLSEFRDNYVSRSRVAMSAVRALTSERKDSANRGRLEQGIISITRKPGSGDGQE